MKARWQSWPGCPNQDTRHRWYGSCVQGLLEMHRFPANGLTNLVWRGPLAENGASGAQSSAVIQGSAEFFCASNF